MSTMPDDETTLPVPEKLAVPERLASAPSDILDIFRDEAEFANDRELKRYAFKLLRAGQTMRATATALGIKMSTLWIWADEPAFREALRSGTAMRRELLARKILDAGDTAIGALDDVAGDNTVAAKDRVKAAEIILDRAGAKFGLGDVTSPTTEQQPTMQVVNVQFNSRLEALTQSPAPAAPPDIIEGTAVHQLPQPTHNRPAPLCPDPDDEDEHEAD